MAAGVSPSLVLSPAAVTGPFSRISRAILARVPRSEPSCAGELVTVGPPVLAGRHVSAVPVGLLISAGEPDTGPDAGRLTPTAALGAPLALAMPVLPTLFTTSVWRKYMPARNAIGHGVAHTSGRFRCYLRPPEGFHRP